MSIEMMTGWGLTIGCFIGIIGLPKEYVTINLLGCFVGVLLLNGGF